MIMATRKVNTDSINIIDLSTDEEKESFSKNIELLKKLQNDECDVLMVTDAPLEVLNVKLIL